MYICLAAALAASAAAQTTDYTQYVNVFTGTTGGGNEFPGVVAEPFAAVKLGPDMAYATADAYSGFLPDADAVVTGYSMLHESGTGGAPKYGVVSQMPVPGKVTNPLLTLSSKRAKDDVGSVGYYKSSLRSGVVTELAGTAHAGLLQYTFPEGETSSIVVDVSHVLPSFRGKGWGQNYIRGSFSISADGHYEGSGTYDRGWNLSPPWTVYFCGKFDQKASSAQTFIGKTTALSELGSAPTVAGTDRLGGLFEFNVPNVTSRVGVSWVSSQRACQYLDEEIPEGTELLDLVSRSKTIWNENVFSKVTTTDNATSNVQLLYTSLYGMHLLPSNRTGDNPGWKSAEPYYDDIFTFWDLFRCTTPLYHILQPVAYEELLRSVIDVWRHDGWLPDARSSNFNGRTQGGSNADNILADAYVKGVRGAINWHDAYAAMQTDAEKVPPNNNDPIAPDSSTQQGRGALLDWLNVGWITPTYTRAVTRAVEYAGNDFGLYQVASGLGRTDDALKYLRRSRQWRNHWNPTETSLGSRGFLVPRLADGSFVQQNALDCGGCYWGAAYYEGKPWEYSVNAHHDAAKLIELSGGNDSFVQRISTLMDPENNIFNPGNEPSFTTPYLFHFAGRQDLSVLNSRRVAKQNYNTNLNGIPGASDAGAMQSWILWNMIGLYPITGQTTFLIGSPWFRQLTIKTPSGRDLNVTSSGGDGEADFYVQSLAINGKPWNKNWLVWDDIFANGGTLAFVLGANPVRWDSGDPPPSPASRRQGVGDSGEAARMGRSDAPTVPAPTLKREPERKNPELRNAIIVGCVLGVVATLSAALAFLWVRRIWLFKLVRETKADREKGGAGEEKSASVSVGQTGKAGADLVEDVREIG